MNNSKTESDYKIITNKLDFMENVLDDPKQGYPEDFQFGELQYPTAKQVQAQQKKLFDDMTLTEALELVLDLAKESRPNYSTDQYYKGKYDIAISKVKSFIHQL